ncbi:MAG: hypothetical protein JW936_08760 [Sedimentisphaerales bacterium]|nr:hypothetical protein [Sedimentisphaerales bacterium]
MTKKRQSRQKTNLNHPAPPTSEPAPNAQPFYCRYFWHLALVIILLTGLLHTGYPFSHGITRPYNGLHSWDEAAAAWIARCHVNYGLAYTHGIATMEVGNPPSPQPLQYLNHPQLTPLVDAAWMYILGPHVWALRVEHLVATMLTVFLLIKVLRPLLGPGVALIAGLFYGIFPITAYFGSRGWVFALALWALWRYLGLIGQLPQAAPKKRLRPLVELALCLFLMIQFDWTGVFYAFTIGLHFVFHTIFQYARAKTKPIWSLFAVIVFFPIAGMFVNFLVMLAGNNWQIKKLIELYQWRSAAAEHESFSWSDWFIQFRNFTINDFTIIVSVITLIYIAYFIIAQIVRFIKGPTAKPWPRILRPWWFLLLPGVFFILAFKGLIWEHQFWFWPFAGFFAVTAACALALVFDFFSKISYRPIAYIAGTLLFAACAFYCAKDTLDYHQVTWQSRRTLQMFQHLQDLIPPDQSLLSFKNFMIQQSDAKLAHYRPEYAWYLDRPIIVAQSIPEIQTQAATGRFPYYFIPDIEQPPYLFYPQADRDLLHSLTDQQLFARMNLAAQQNDQNLLRTLNYERYDRYRRAVIAQLKLLYPYEHIEQDPHDICGRGNTPCYIFDLRRPLTTTPPSTEPQ